MLDDLLVVAWDLTTDSRVHVAEQTLEHWRRKGYGGDQTLVCMYCLQQGDRVALVVKGKVLGARRAHFAHPANTAHVACHRPETAWHADGKWLIADMARRHPAIDLVLIEWPTPDNKRRADVRVLLRDGSKLAFELQTAPLTDRDYLARCEDYERNNITSVWLWRPGLSRPGIMLQQRQPIWWLNVVHRQITGLFGQPHPCADGWDTHDDLTPYAMHWPPCPDDNLATHTWDLNQTVVDDTGFRPAMHIDALIDRHRRQVKEQIDTKQRLEMMAAKRAKARTTPQPGPSISPGNTDQGTARGARHAPPQMDPSAGPYAAPPDNLEELIVRHLIAQRPGPAKILIGNPDPQLANGRPVYVDGRFNGIASPHPQTASQWNDLAGHVIYVPEVQVHWFGRTAPLGTKMHIIRSRLRSDNGRGAEPTSAEARFSVMTDGHHSNPMTSASC